MTFDNLEDLCVQLEECFELPVYLRQRYEQPKGDHFLVDILGTSNMYADNGVYMYTYQIQLSYLTKLSANCTKYDRMMKSLFNATNAFNGFEADNEWWLVPYRFEVILLG